MKDLLLESDHNQSPISAMKERQCQVDNAVSTESMVSMKCAEEHYQALCEAQKKETKAISISYECDELKNKVRKKNDFVYGFAKNRIGFRLLHFEFILFYKLCSNNSNELKTIWCKGEHISCKHIN